MDLIFSHTPDLFGWEHLGMLAAILLLSTVLFLLLRKMPPKVLVRWIFVLSVCMFALEVWKQWFTARYVYPGRRSDWFFPWQLCSMAMYCGVLLPFLKGKSEDAVLVFLSSYSLLAAFFALLLPYDMLRPQIPLFLHSFLYHAAMVVQSLAAALILKEKKAVSFVPAFLLFCGMAVIAEIINVISHNHVSDPSLEANMFYITPYYPSTQPVFHTIALKLGIFPEILIYLLSISLGSFLLYLLERRSRVSAHGGA